MLTETARTAAAILLTAGLCLPVQAQDAAPAEAQPEAVETAEAEAAASAEGMPDGFAVLEKHVEAIGGAEAGMAIKGLRMVGTMTFPAMNTSGELTVSAAPPAKQLVTISLTGIGNVVQGTDGERAWASQPIGDPVMVSGPQADAMIENAQFYARYTPRDSYTSATTTGTEAVEGTECYVVDLVSSSGEESVGYYSIETGHRLAEKTRMAPGSQSIAREITYHDFETFDGHTFATRMLMTEQGSTREIVFETVEIDPEFAPGTFDAPTDL